MKMNKNTDGDNKEEFTVKLEGGQGLKFQKVKRFTYLGVCIAEEGGDTAEITARLIKGDKSTGALSNILKNKNISMKTKATIYKSIIRPTVTYGCETWTMTKKEEERLNVWERKVLRRCLGGVKEGDIWRRRTNRELEDLYREASITQYVRAQRIRWLGHIQRREDTRTVKKVLNAQAATTRRKGRPKARWLTSVLHDLREKGIRNWKTRAENREEWRDILKLWA